MTPTGITVSSYLENETDLSEFNKAWIKTNLKNTLRDRIDYTIFAPNN